MGYSNWKNYFNKSSFKIIGYIDKLPVHSPYRLGLNRIRKYLEFLGLSSSHGIVLVKQSSTKDQIFCGYPILKNYETIKANYC